MILHLFVLEAVAEVRWLKKDLLITSSMDVLLINLFSALPAPYSEISLGSKSLSSWRPGLRKSSVKESCLSSERRSLPLSLCFFLKQLHHLQKKPHNFPRICTFWSLFLVVWGLFPSSPWSFWLIPWGHEYHQCFLSGFCPWCYSCLIWTSSLVLAVLCCCSKIISSCWLVSWECDIHE